MENELVYNGERKKDPCWVNSRNEDTGEAADRLKTGD